jgi:hypothetical protein
VFGALAAIASYPQKPSAERYQLFQIQISSVPNCSKSPKKSAKKRPKSVPNCSTLKHIGATNQGFSTVNRFCTLYIFWNSTTPLFTLRKIYCFSIAKPNLPEKSFS